MSRAKSSRVDKLIGYGSAISSVIAYDVSSCCVQALQGAIPDVQLSLARAVVQLLLFVIGARVAGNELNVKREKIPGILCLGAAFIAFNLGLYGAVAYLPLTEVAGILAIVMMITAFLFSRFLFNTDIAKSNFISITVCTVGILLTVQPQWLFRYARSDCNIKLSSFKNVSKVLENSGCSGLSMNAMLTGYVLSIIGGVGCGVTFDICGILLQGINPIVQAVYGVALCAVVSVALMFYMEDPVLVIDINQFMLVLGHGVSSVFTTFLAFLAAKYISGPSLSVVFSFDLVTQLICQYTIMHSIMPGNYNWIEVVGCLLIAFGASIPATMDMLAHRAKAGELP